MRRLMNWLDTAAIAISGLCLIVMMLIVSWDTFSRYALGAPLVWSFEIISYYLLVISLYLAISPTFTRDDHVSIDLFRQMFPDRLRDWIDVIWCLMAAAVFALIVWASWRSLGHSFQRNQFFPGLIRWPAWISFLPIVIGTGLIVLRLVVHAAELAFRGRRPGVTLPGGTTE